MLSGAIQEHAGFEKKIGWQIEHFLNMYFSESTVIRRDEIVAAANAHRLADIDFVFDEFLSRLSTRTRDSCEFTWCRTRVNYPYV